MIDWKKLADEKPQDRQMCWITGDSNMIMGPLPWQKDAGGFLDLFATPEAGAIYSDKNGVTHWTNESSINVPD